MNTKGKDEQQEKVECHICLKEIPASGARSEETKDYVLHFCGLDCYSRWKEQEHEKEKE